MIIEYKIEEKDFLTHQLYTASRSERIKKKRKKNKLLVPLMYLIVAPLMYSMDFKVASVIILLLALLWYLFYPLWERQHYFNHYQSVVKEHYKDVHLTPVSLEISNDFLLAKANGSESKISTVEIEEINEIPAALFIKLKGTQSFILPKDKINNIEALAQRLKELAHYLNIKYNIENAWAWK